MRDVFSISRPRTGLQLASVVKSPSNHSSSMIDRYLPMRLTRTILFAKQVLSYLGNESLPAWVWEFAMDRECRESGKVFKAGCVRTGMQSQASGHPRKRGRSIEPTNQRLRDTRVRPYLGRYITDGKLDDIEELLSLSKVATNRLISNRFPATCRTLFSVRQRIGDYRP